MPRRDEYDDDFDDQYDDDFDQDDAFDDAAETVPCPYCGEEIYEEAVQCPHCGKYLSAEDAPGGASRGPMKWWVALGLILALLIVASWLVL